MSVAFDLRSFSVLALSLAAAFVQAGDVFSNLDPGPNAYRLDVGWVFGEAGFPDQGFQFVTTSAGTLTGLTVAVNRYFVGSQADFTMSLYADDGADHLGALLETFAGTSTNVSFEHASDLLVFASPTSPAVTVQSGTKYWLVASGASPLVWSMENGNGVLQYHSGLYEYHTGQGAGAFSLQATPVPEPASLVGIALGAAGFLRRKAKTA